MDVKMTKLKDCKELNPFDHLYILEHIDNIQLDKIYSTIKDYSTIKLQSMKCQDNIVIIHQSSKKENTIQVSYFDNSGAYADKERLTLKDALKEVYKDYIIKEVA
jgi:hypothetical protein